LGSVTLCRLGRLGRVLVPDCEVGLGVLPAVVGLGLGVGGHVHVDVLAVAVVGVEDADHADLEGIGVVGGAAAARGAGRGRELAQRVVGALRGLVGGLLEGLVLGVAVRADAIVGQRVVPRVEHGDGAVRADHELPPARLDHALGLAALGRAAGVAGGLVVDVEAHASSLLCELAVADDGADGDVLRRGRLAPADAA
jgi:hypothetical protein